MLTVSNIVEEQKLFDSNSFKQLTPVLQSTVKQIFKFCEEDTSANDLVVKFENALELLVGVNKIERKQLEDYFDDEISERLGKLGE